MSARAWKRRRAQRDLNWLRRFLGLRSWPTKRGARRLLAQRGRERRAWVARRWTEWRSDPAVVRLTPFALATWRRGSWLEVPGRQPRCRSIGVLEDSIHNGTGTYRAAKASRYIPGRPPRNRA